MRAVMISIQPKWCELIANGKKTVEVRKTKPKLEMPFKVYIYCTQQGRYFYHGGLGEKQNLFKNPDTGKIKFDFAFELMCCEKEYTKDNFLSGKVIGEFVCDEIVRFENKRYDLAFDEIVNRACIEPYDLAKYLLPQCYAYGWHISDLVIYDKPKELWEFINYNKQKICLERNCFSGDCYICPNNSIVIRPFQSWGYVEELSND